MATKPAEVKPGYKTTEFWVSIAACALGAFVASGVLPEESVWMKLAGMGLTALTALGYTVSRWVVKKNA